MVGIDLTLKPDVRCHNRTQQLGDWVAAMRYRSPPPTPPRSGVSAVESPPMTAAEQAPISEYAISGTPQVFHLLRPLKRTRSIYDMEERTMAQLRRPGLTPSDGREWGGRALKRTRSIYEMEERDAAQLHRPGLTPSDGRERGGRPLKRTRSIYEMEERDAAQLHRPGLTPSDGRERGKRPRWNTEI